MVELEIDGKKVEVPEGSMVMHACEKMGTYVPHFCYHPKLSIAANCRMCLVDVEKAPKPMPACATPVTQGMIVRTKSDKAVNAQKGVMEFLLINHPLDCPICDQGGECQLQDLAVGYGGAGSRYTEEKRVVFHKDAGPLISMQEMSRCIHCTRCVRFGQEVAGVMELGMAHRGEHAEITAFVGMTIDSELSGNMIDLCPVGALTSKPFRYSARTWELGRRKSISPHDSTGANLVVQVKNNKVMRVLPLENSEVNECWIADRDRFSYEALNGADRLTAPMVKQNGAWQTTDWQTALQLVADKLNAIKAKDGANAVGALASPHSTLEELHLLQKVMRGFGSENIDFRLRASDFSEDGQRSGAYWLGAPIASLSSVQRALIVGSTLRKEHPLFSARLRLASKKGAQINVIHSSDDDLLMNIHARQIVGPSGFGNALAQVLKAVAVAQGESSLADLETELGAEFAALEVGDVAHKMAKSLLSAERKAILLGNAVAHHDHMAQLLALANRIGAATGATVGFLTEAANTVGAYIANATPGQGGKNAHAMTQTALQAYVLLHTEPEFDCADGAAALAAMKAASFVVAMSPFKHAALDYADVLLPISPFSETSGTFVNAEGRAQSFNGVVRPLGDTRPAWKVLRVLGNLLKVEACEFDSSEAVRAQVLGAGIGDKLNNSVKAVIKNAVVSAPSNNIATERIAYIPLYSSDALVRRAPALQQTADAKAPTAGLGSSLWQQLGLGGLQSNVSVTLTNGAAQITLAAERDDRLPANAVRLAAGHRATYALGAMNAAVSVSVAVEKA